MLRPQGLRGFINNDKEKFPGLFSDTYLSFLILRILSETTALFDESKN